MDNDDIFGCVLIGGQSRRMGRPKHLLQIKNATFVERIVTTMQTVVETVVIAGKGELPSSLSALHRLTDAPGVKGPMAGILSALRWNRRVAWLVTACDMPHVTPQAYRWLLDQRSSDYWGFLPSQKDSRRCEPLLAVYEPPCIHLLQEMADKGDFRLSDLENHPKFLSIPIPQDLQSAWNNINTEDDFQALNVR